MLKCSVLQARGSAAPGIPWKEGYEDNSLSRRRVRYSRGSGKGIEHARVQDCFEIRRRLGVIREEAGIDLVITDYRMPGMTGVEFIAALRQILPSVPAVVLTGCSSVEVYIKSLSLGVFEYLSKPVKVKELDRILKSAFERTDAGNVLLTA